MKKRISLMLISLMTATMVLGGCGSKSSTATNGQSTKSGEVTKLNLWTFIGLHSNLYNDAAKSWNKAHPDQPIELKVTTYPYTDMHNKLLVAVKSGVGAPDIADIEVGQFPNFTKGTPQLADLSDIVAPEKANFIQSRLDLYSKGGKVYGLPTHVGTTVAFYNKDLFKKAGVDYTKIKTWDDYTAAGKIVKAKTGKYMGYLSQTANWEFSLMVGQQGSDVFDKSGNVTLDNPVAVKSLQLLHDMVFTDKIAAISPGGQPDTEEGYGAFNKGGAASVIMPFWYTSRFLANMPDLKGKIAIQAPPVFATGNKNLSVGLGGTGTAVPIQGKNVELAKKFLFFAKGTENASENIWNLEGFDPPRWDSWKKISANIGDTKFTQYFSNGKDAFNVLLPLKDSIATPVSIEKSPNAGTLLNSQVLFKVLKQNSATPQAALKTAADELRKN
ncbi:extracellular solute-binding protein [Clostridium estertheticum]|uniref:Extracellular solute-binding protein n=1 Tax=Clostridium estertheticum TaxID=238834 RepID=A0AA47EHX2_9CLOT|nr:sugar ABC transporter substrate-binding protein [Clostridium estertheticum]MBU3155443.1 extracellular solute-binding protein [Clostridium estertheticum]MBU3199527.1 extracellular solute-binding protein [Clostridium estertheticum]WAG60512.1 extracellular solute-binding protein [Clostridium estertheticum]WAG65397.1 extracellular solute-binding protein [Clostridium estertheticum]